MHRKKKSLKMWKQFKECVETVCEEEEQYFMETKWTK